jgi:hypothetical protein
MSAPASLQVFVEGAYFAAPVIADGPAVHASSPVGGQAEDAALEPLRIFAGTFGRRARHRRDPRSART